MLDEGRLAQAGRLLSTSSQGTAGALFFWVQVHLALQLHLLAMLQLLWLLIPLLHIASSSLELLLQPALALVQVQMKLQLLVALLHVAPAFLPLLRLMQVPARVQVQVNLQLRVPLLHIAFSSSSSSLLTPTALLLELVLAQSPAVLQEKATRTPSHGA